MERLIFFVFSWIILIPDACERNDYNSSPLVRSYVDYRVYIEYINEEVYNNPRLRDSLLVDFAEGFENTTVEVYVNGKSKYNGIVTTDRSTGLAENVIIDNMNCANTVGFRINHSKLIVVEPDINQRLLKIDIINEDSIKTYSFRFLQRAWIYE